MKAVVHLALVAGTLLAAWPASAMNVGPYRGGPNTSRAAERILAAHNRERARMGAAPLAWDERLAASAAAYGPMLEQMGALRHSPRTMRPGQSENLWMGSRGYYSPEQMVGTWLAERTHMRPGIFPAVSRTGRWEDIGHYTQVVWPTTTHVGCAVYSAAANDFLVCRYSPKGNVDGYRFR
ncbi:CAP domain-containing protein [Sphingomonas sp. GCM10030256]|uniref:CAP domain-containing protein n=1 Tax=Sphingomonas sp. GCM10030256 TaxID=3273427 RepID=UPI003622A3FF